VYASISSCWLLRPENTRDLQKVRKTANRQEEKYQKEGEARIIQELSRASAGAAARHALNSLACGHAY
jgi:UDP-2,3-diacylglucosamine pyrophosphatase LpxH